jgi:hypothetical protein
VTGPDQHHAALRVSDQSNPAQYEGTHDDLADIRLTGNKAPEVGTLNPDYTRHTASTAGHQNLSIIE